MKITQADGYVCLENLSDFNLSHIFECGQCFRFKKQDDGSFIGVAFNQVWHFYEKDGKVFVSGTLEQFNEYMYDFLDLDRDYSLIKKDFAIDDFTRNAVNFGSGIRILKQDPWEALCSFIISQCNRIPRIMNIVDALCTNFGDEIIFNDKIYYSFPSYKKLSKLTDADLKIISSGYRSTYIIDAAKALDNGSLNFESLKDMDISNARKEVLKLNGVGIKVTDCFLLFGLGKLDAFPIDTWIKKAQKFYDGDMSNYGEFAGIYQQYIFYYIKNLGI